MKDRDSFARRLASAVGMVASAGVIGRVLGFAGNVLAGRLIGVASFGMLGMVRSSLSLGATLADPGIGSMASRYLPRWRGTQEANVDELLGLAFIVAVIGSIVVGIAMAWLAPTLASDVYGTPNLAPLLVAAVPWVVATSVGNMAEEVLRGFERFGVLATVGVVRGVVTLLLLSAVLVAWRATALAAVLALGASQTIIGAILLASAWDEAVRKRDGRLRWPGKATVIEPLRRFALPSYCFLLLQAPLSWFLLTRLARVEEGAAFVGAVQATGSFRGALDIVAVALATTLLPILSRVHSVAPAETFSRRVRSITHVLWFLAVPLGALLAGSLPFLLYLVFGSSFGAYGVPCAVLVLVTAWSMVNELFDRTLAATGRMWLSFSLGLAYAIAAVCLTVVLVPRLQLWGYVIAQFGAMAGYVVVQQEAVGRRVQYPISDRCIAIGLALGGGALSVAVAGLISGWAAPLAASLLGFVLAVFGWSFLLTVAEREFVRGTVLSAVSTFHARVTR